MERSRRYCPGCASSRPPGRRPLGVFALRSGLAPSLLRRPLRLLSSSFASSASLFSSSSSFLSSSSSSSSFPPPPPPQPPPPTAPTPLPPGHPGPCRVSGLRCLCCGPLDPKPAALELMGLNHGRTRRFLHTLSSAAVVPWRPAPGSLRWLRAPGEGEPMRQLVSTQYVPSSEWNY